jgi:hypothetical protein
MLRLFRDIRRRLIMPDTVRRYLLYAIGEIFLVVIGILIALQVNNWNEAKIDRKFELNMLHDINISLNENISLVNSQFQNLDNISNSVNKLAQYQNDTGFNKDSLVHHLNIARFGGTAITFNNSAYESLKSSGLNRVSDSELRNSIALLFEVELSIAEQWINEVVRKKLYDKDVYARSYFELEAIPDSINGISPKLLPPDFEKISSDPGFDTFLILAGGYISSTRLRLSLVKSKMEDVQKQIERELEKKN